MPAVRNTSVRNLSMDLVKMAGSVLVVFNHISFPGNWYGFWDCLCRFAVPFFFTVSGYFNYGANCRQIQNRLFHIIKLNIIADIVHLICNCLVIESNGGSSVAYLIASVPDLDELLTLLILHRNTFLGHLWYMASIACVYALYWIYIGFFGSKPVNYRPLYAAGFFAFTIYFACAIVMPVSDSSVSSAFCRNGWFLGLPMFTFGLFVREFQEQILENYKLTPRKLILIAVVGILLSLVQWKVIGLSGTPFGMPIEVAALFLLCVRCPQFFPKWKFLQTVCAKCGTLSTGMYLFHLSVYLLYKAFLQPSLLARFGENELVLQPVLVLLLPSSGNGPNGC